jgi:hypothetical protein
VNLLSVRLPAAQVYVSLHIIDIIEALPALHRENVIVSTQPRAVPKEDTSAAQH